MKVILFNAISLNSKIAGKNGNENFISDKNWNEFCSLVNKAGCLIFSRKTYEVVKSWDKKYLNKIKAKIIIVSRKWENNLADEVIIDIEPVIVGEGKNLIEEGKFKSKLKLLKLKRIGDIIQLRYKILK
jgi:dihydrofolate reductase